MTTPLVIGLGALNIDRIFKVKSVLADGETSIQSAGVFPGGSAANTIAGLSKLGVATGFCGAVGSDEAGRMLLSAFRAVGTDTRHIEIKPDRESGTVFCVSDAEQRSLYVLAGANGDLSGDDIDQDYLSRAAWLHLSSFVDDSQFELSRDIVSNLPKEVKLSFSPGSLYVNRGFSCLKPFFKRTEVLFLNRGEIETLTQEPFEQGAATLLASGCRRVVVTFGKGINRLGKGFAAYIRDNRNTVWVNAARKESEKIADTTGAGDAFAAGFLFGLTGNKDVQTCGEYGHTAATLSLRYCGAREGLPDKAQLTGEHKSLYGL